MKWLYVFNIAVALISFGASLARHDYLVCMMWFVNAAAWGFAWLEANR